MFTTGQIYFGAIFVIVFALAMIYTYRKDLRLHKVYYKGSSWVFLTFLSFIGILFVIKVMLKD